MDRKKTIGFPEPVMEAIDNLVKAGLFTNRTDAVRSIVIQWLMTHGYLALEPAELPQGDGYGRSMRTFTLKIPQGLYFLLIRKREELGMTNLSAFIRLAIIHFIVSTSKRKDEGD